MLQLPIEGHHVHPCRNQLLLATCERNHRTLLFHVLLEDVQLQPYNQ